MTPEEFEQIKQRIEQLELFVARISKTDRYLFEKNVQMFDGRNIQFGTTAGTKIGTSATQKLGFFGYPPVIQQGAIAQASGGITVDAQARGAINTLLTEVASLGLIAS